jgi:hypothetical protein
MKKKLRLQIDELRVEQFKTHPDSPVAGGTVHGFETDVQDTCIWRYCTDVPGGTQYLAATDCC